MYPRHIIEQVLNSTDIVKLVSTYCELKPAGSDRYVALCPFHTEKTPSFTVSKSRQIYYCFGCGKGGDAVSFLKDIQNVSFKDALEILADEAGIRLPKSNYSSKERSPEQNDRKTLFQIIELSVEFYRNQLTKSLNGKIALEYLKKRNISSEIQEEFKLGFAPADGYALYRFLKSKGFPEQLLLRSGLIRSGRDDGRYYDFFRNRILFPIRNIEGKVISFGGREITGEGPKYINLPETEIYQKNKVLYGLWEGKEAIRSYENVILVEGYIDVLKCFQSGIRNVVATCGTALTAGQANLMKRFAPKVIIVYDGDEAGLSASIRATSVLLQSGLSVSAVALPDGKDPDDFLQSNPVSEWEERISSASPFFTFYLQQKQNLLATPQGKITVLSELFRLISIMEENAIKEEFLKEIASALRISFWAVKSDYEQYLKNNYSVRSQMNNSPQENVSVDDIDFLHALINNKQIKMQAKRLFQEIPLPETPLGTAVKYILENEDPDPRFMEESEGKNLLQKVLLSEPINDDITTLAEERLNRLHIEYINQRIGSVQRQIQEAEKQQQKERLMKLLSIQKELITKRSQLSSIQIKGKR
ncbi:MAG: DNA primase [Candidatus Hydrogenedens sp.]